MVNCMAHAYIKKLLEGNEGKKIEDETSFSVVLCYLLNITYNCVCFLIFELLEKAENEIT